MRDYTQHTERATYISLVNHLSARKENEAGFCVICDHGLCFFLSVNSLL